MFNIVCPCAGLGSRTKEKYNLPKPLIEVNGKSLINWVIDNVWCKEANFIFIVQREHCKEFKLDEHIEEKCKQLGSSCKIIQIDGLTEGSACTILKAKDLINNDLPCLSVNCDQYVPNFSSYSFMKQMEIENADGIILVFTNNSPKWSFVKVNKCGQVCRVEEKNPISDLATVGYYGFAKGSDFVKYLQEMICDNFRVNNEFYTAPVYKYLIANGGIIKVYYTDKMMGLGTIEDIERFRSERTV